MSSIRPFLLLSLLGVLSASCATSSRTAGERSPARPDVLTSDDLVSSQETNLLDAIRRTRPSWLRTRGAVSAMGPDEVVVFVDDVRMGAVDFLAGMRIEGVHEVRFIHASDATTRWGMGVAGGVIQVITKPGGR